MYQTTVATSSYRQEDRILLPGRNCWRIEQADRALLLTNQDYFRALAASLIEARRHVILLGWELDAKLVLDPRHGPPRSLPLVEFLLALLAERPDLEIRLLLWNRPLVYGGNRKARALFEASRINPRLKVCFKPAGFLASLHHKLICIDDRVAYVGGIDVTGDRWDRRDHPVHHPRRVTPEGEVYGPIHDLQILLEGNAATAMAELARHWWTRGTGEVLPPPQPLPERCWPAEAAPDFTGVPVAIARTDPHAHPRPVREVEKLNVDALARARHCIYIEAQYLAAWSTVGDVLFEQLQKPDGPEIVVIVTYHLGGVLERCVMHTNRDRLIRHLRAADRYDRLRVYYPTVGDARGNVEIKVHAKLMVIDNHFLRIGSSNLNHRSTGVDVECDVAIEAVDGATRDRIAAKRGAFLAQQLGRSLDEVQQTLERTGSQIRTIELLNGEGRLQPVPAMFDPRPDKPLPGTFLLDPSKPITWSYVKRHLRRRPPALRLA